MFRGRTGSALEYLERFVASQEVISPVYAVNNRLWLGARLYATEGRGDRILALADSQRPLGGVARFHAELAVATVHLVNGDLDAAENAVRAAEQALATFRNYWDAAHLALRHGEVLEKRGELVRALEAYENAAKLGGLEFRGADVPIGRCQRKLGRAPAARSTLQRALVRRPADAHAHLELGLLELDAGRHGAARRHLDAAARTWAEADENHEGARQLRAALAALKSS
jgi:tetratricopeptide (TPR) repeat protein